MTGEITDKDLGFNEFVKRIEGLTDKGVLVGIMEGSPRAQFRRGMDQEFRPETAGTLLRQPVDANKDKITKRLTEIGRNSILAGVNPDKDLLKLGEDIKNDMAAQTDPPPQLQNALIVKLDDGS